MARFRLGTAPVSWGVAGPDWGPRPPVERVLSEMAQAGYEGTELGPWGFMPTEAKPLGELLARYNLALASAFCPVNLHSPELDPQQLADLRIEAALLAELGARDIVMSDTGSPHRKAIAGRVKAEANGDALDTQGWRQVREHMKRICDISAPLGLRVCYHHHVGTYVETDEEIAAFVEAVHGLPVGLCLDTGHLAYAGADPIATVRTHASLINFCHLKDFDQVVLNECLRKGLDFTQTVKAGVFVPLGQGDLDYPTILGALRSAGYDGWLIVEQDRLVTSGDNPMADARTSLDFLKGLLEK